MGDDNQQADMYLQSGHLYLWGDRLFNAEKGNRGWSLLYIDRKTGKPRPPAPGALNSYFLMRGSWYEALYASGERQFKVGAVVEIDLRQFRDLAGSASIDLVEGHIYSDGKIVYEASRADLPFVRTLTRVNIDRGVLVAPIVANSLVAYFQHEHGYWYVLRVGNEHTDRSKVLGLAPDFASEILPKLVHVADSLQNYVNCMT